ncbi:flavodoxin domain-containing protein [bacterium]|nr:flavodoxin domain-containing protein [bacterium]
MKPVEIKKGVYWVGGVDWTLRNFHGYLTQRGSTYNAYLVIDEKITLIDGVKHYLTDELLERISHIIDPAKIDYLVCNHVEMDHSGAIPKIIELNPKVKVFASPNGVKGLKAHYKADWDFHAVNTGESLSLGKRSLSFVLTQMLHWPDNMVSYMPEEKILFSNDAFGQHIASHERFDDEYPQNIIMEESKKYYANIVMPYGTMVSKALKTLGGLEIDIIAPSHGIMWRENIPGILAEYSKWCKNESEKSALIIYDTMWDSTHKMATAISRAFENKGIPFDMVSLQHTHISDVITKVLTAKYICVGSPTLNNNILPTVAGFLAYFKGLAPKNRVGLAFGSYGWGGQSVGIVHKDLESCKFDMLEPIKFMWVPGEDDLKAITEKVESQL